MNPNKTSARTKHSMAKEIKLLCLIDSHFTIDEMNAIKTGTKEMTLYDTFENLTELILQKLEPRKSKDMTNAMNDYISFEFIPSLHKFNNSKSINH